MVDQKQIADIFTDFLGLYLGKKDTGILALCKKYENHRMLLGLLSNLDEAAKVPVPQIMKEAYAYYKDYRGKELTDKEWEMVTSEASRLAKKWDNNKWCKRVVIELMTLLEADERERKRTETEEGQKAA